jgi:glycosyltransferase involved in cell wall biosynthesis
MSSKVPVQKNASPQMPAPRVLAILPALIPSTIIDVVTPLLDLNKAGLINAKITVEPFARKHHVEWCDIVILCRNIHPDSAGWFRHILASGKPYIYDIDDNFFDLPIDTALGRYHRERSRIKMLKEYLRLAHLVRVYSTPMYAHVQKLNRNVTKVLAPLDWRLIKSPGNMSEHDAIKIVYATSRTDDHLAEIFKQPLIRILEDYREQVQVYFLGYNPPEFRKYPNVFFQPMIFDYELYLKSFSSAGYDIGLAPLLDDKFHRSKTNNKFREYGASGIAGIYSNMEVYSTCVVHNKTGLLVQDDPDAWYAAMALLIENHALRRRIQVGALKFVRANYSQEMFSTLWYQQIVGILRNPQRGKISTRAVEKLIADHAGASIVTTIARILVDWMRHAFGAVVRVRDRLMNYTKMYWVLLKIRLKLLGF